MQCPSCGTVVDSSDACAECGLEMRDTARTEDKGSPVVSNKTKRKTSTLIEFPGVSRSSLPEWRKELSERVREVQERRAKEAAQEAEIQREQRETQSSAVPQLELLPHASLPTMNPLVAAALKRIERAHQVQRRESSAPRQATAVAYAPRRDEVENSDHLESPLPPQFHVAHNPGSAELQTEPGLQEKVHNLVVVPPLEPEPVVKQTPPSAPKRLIVDDPNDPALNYLDSISKSICVDEINPHRASLFRRLVGGLIDLLIAATLSSPVVLILKYSGTSLDELRSIAFLTGTAVIITFLYLTISTALTGRTWGMRLLRLKVIDMKTGLIPTGGQSAGRAIVYLISLTAAGLGILCALASREGQTVHDRLTRTAVITI
ncbi:MAG: RDD family protein [Pyrinomonadaceae bacterium]